jgi:hypothetical protein
MLSDAVVMAPFFRVTVNFHGPNPHCFTRCAILGICFGIFGVEMCCLFKYLSIFSIFIFLSYICFVHIRWKLVYFWRQVLKCIFLEKQDSEERHTYVELCMAGSKSYN